MPLIKKLLPSNERVMIFHTSIRRELMRSFSAALFVLVGIMVTMMLIRTLGFANRGLVSPSEVSLVLGIRCWRIFQRF